MELLNKAMLTYEAHVVKQEGCWGWKGSKNSGGYGKVSVRLDSKSVTISAHRLSYTVHNGDIPEGKLVLHTCDNPICTNPEHLFLGTHLENMQDKCTKGRSSTIKSISNAKLTVERVLYIWEARNKLTAKTLAADLGVSEYTVRDIWLKRTWKHITDPTPQPQDATLD